MIEITLYILFIYVNVCVAKNGTRTRNRDPKDKNREKTICLLTPVSWFFTLATIILFQFYSHQYREYLFH